jgi:segregation and condensation protein A
MRPGSSPGVPVMATPEELDQLGPAPAAAPVLLAPVAPAVSFGEGRRPESRTQVQMAEFDGPLALLLSLIEARQLDVLTVPLAALADAYLDALARLTADRLGNVSSFVAIASQLILIKSRAMLPRRTDPTDPMAIPDEGTDPEAELRARLLLYRAYRDAGTRLAEEAVRRIGLFRREPGAAHAAGLAGARPTDALALDPLRLVRALDRLAEIAPPPEPPSELMTRSITITERAEIIRAALRDAPTFVLQDLLAGVRDRVVIAVTFLAMLELMKRREIVVEQAEPWGPIVARSTTAQERAAAGVELLDDAPLDETLESFA